MSSTPILLSSESTEEFATLRARISHEIQPQGEIEQLFTDDIAPNTSDIRRISRNKIGIIRNAFPAALQNLLRQLLHHEEYLHDIPIDDPILQTAANYFSDPQAAETILLVLRKFGLTATAIESEACRLVARELEAFDKMQSNAERRRYKCIKFIAQYRKSLSIQTRPVTDSIITEPDALCLKSSTSGSDHGDYKTNRS